MIKLNLPKLTLEEWKEKYFPGKDTPPSLYETVKEWCDIARDNRWDAVEENRRGSMCFYEGMISAYGRVLEEIRKKEEV